MRLRTLKPLMSSYGGFPPGVIVNVPAKVGKNWCRIGLAMQDKSLDGGSENKAEVPPPLPIPAPETNTAGYKPKKSKNKAKAVKDACKADTR